MRSHSGADQRLKSFREKELRLDELVDISARLLPLFVGKQTRHKVNDFPDKRTLRYYAQRGLIDKPLRRGRVSIFSYRHLLQVLAIKRLQSDYLPLRRIKEITRVSSEQELEQLLLLEGQENDEHLPMKALSRLGVGDPASGKLSPVPPSKHRWTSCHKFKIDEHLELHVEEGFELLRSSIDLDVINARIMNALSIFSFNEVDCSAYDAASPTAISHQPDSLYYHRPSPIESLREATVVLITEGGLVPKGNPDRLESVHATRFLKYSLADIGNLEEDAFESIDSGWDTTYVNADPDRLLPLDVMRDIEANRLIGKMHRFFYTTTGVATTIDTARKIGRGIAAELIREEVSAAILTAT